MAAKNSGLEIPHPVLSAAFQRWLDSVEVLRSRRERLSEYTVRLGVIDTALTRLKLQRAVVKSKALLEARSLGLTKFLAYTHRTALVLTIPMTFAARHSNAATAKAVRSLLINRLGSAAVKGGIKKVVKRTRTVSYVMDEGLRAQVHALNDPQLELELAKLLGCTIEATAGKPSKELLRYLLEEEHAQG